VSNDGSRGSIVGTVSRVRALWVRCLNTGSEKRSFSPPKFPHPNLGHTQPSVQCEGGEGSLKLPGQEFDHLPASSAEVQNDWIFTATAPICLLGVGKLED